MIFMISPGRAAYKLLFTFNLIDNKKACPFIWKTV